MQPDPALELIAGVDVTWPSAFLVDRNGRHTAIVGFYDGENVRNRNAYAAVIGYHQGIGVHLLAALDQYDPAAIAINFSENDVAADGLSYGMYRTLLRYLDETPYAGRLVSAEKIIAALRGRKSQTEVARVRRAIATTEDLFDEVERFAQPGMTQRQIAEFVHGRIDALACV